MEAKYCVIKNTSIKAFVFLQGKDTINIGFSFVNNELFLFKKKEADVNIRYQISLSYLPIN